MMHLAFPKFDHRERELVDECLSSGWVTQGPLTERFEAQLASRHQVSQAMATTSCTAALHLAILALGLRPGDEVIVPAFTWITSASCAEYVGAKPVFVDCDPNTYNIDPNKIKAAITPNTRAIVAVHLFGLAADIDAIKAVVGDQKIAIIEDAACAIGTLYKGVPVGGLGDLGCFSFHPRKVITTGEGGLVTTSNEILAERVKIFRNHGSMHKPELRDGEKPGPWTMAEFGEAGFNLRLSDIQSAVGLAQLEKLDGLLSDRRRRARDYDEKLAELVGIALPFQDAGHSYQSYVIRLTDRGRKYRNVVMQALSKANIATRPGTHSVPNTAFYKSKYDLKPTDFPIATSLENETITLPLFPGMTSNHVDQVVAALRSALSYTPMTRLTCSIT